MFRIRFTVTLLAIAALTACATTGPVYRAASSAPPKGLGYTDETVAPDHQRVTFVGNTSLGTEGVRNLALLRAADWTAAQGHAWFRVLYRVVSQVQVEAPRQEFATTNQSLSCNTSSTQGSQPGAATMGCSYGSAEGSIGGVRSRSTGGYAFHLVAVIDFATGDGPMPEGDQVYDAKATAAKIRTEMNLQ